MEQPLEWIGVAIVVALLVGVAPNLVQSRRRG
jgi:hypothetical protein